MKLRVDEDICIGCGACQAICPEVFDVDRVAKVVVDEISEEVKDDAIDAMEGCPVAAIVEEKEEEK
ncbi:MAG: ferredoxin [Bacilli bacterium]|nr:ferredoxin [Bacilli bacterium]